MGFIRAREVVDEASGETRRYYQLVEDQQRVVAHLGEHPTVEDAVTELRGRLRELEVERDEHRREAEEHASAIVQTYPAQLERYHGGRIPTRNEHHGMAWPKPWATEKGRRYMRDFGRVEWKPSSRREGQTYEAYSGYETFASWVRAYRWHEKKVAGLQARIDRLSAKLEKFEGLSVTGSGDAG